MTHVLCLFFKTDSGDVYLGNFLRGINLQGITNFGLPVASGEVFGFGRRLTANLTIFGFGVVFALIGCLISFRRTQRWKVKRHAVKMLVFLLGNRLIIYAILKTQTRSVQNSELSSGEKPSTA